MKERLMIGKDTNEKLDTEDSATSFDNDDDNISFVNSSDVDERPFCFSTCLIAVDVATNYCSR